MGGPKTTRLNNASQPGLTPYGTNLLQQLFAGYGGQGAGATGQQRNPFANGPFKGVFGSAGGGGMGGPIGSPPQGGGGLYGQLGDVLGGPRWQDFGGQQVLNTAQPLFQRNLADALNLQRENGPRFSSGQDLLGMQTSQRALQDFNQFAAQVLQQGQQTQLQAAAAQQNALAPFLQTLFNAGGFNSAPIYQQTPGLGQQLLGLAGTLGGAYLGGGLGGAAAGAAGGAGRGAPGMGIYGP